MAENRVLLRAYEGRAPYARRRLVLVMVLAAVSLFVMPSVIPDVEAASYTFISHTFTPCGATGTNGPTLANCTSSYSTTWDDNSSNFNVSGGIQLWTVPVTGLYQVTAAGARGGGSNYGSGRIVRGRTILNEGDVLKIIVGQEGIVSTTSGLTGGGGGGLSSPRRPTSRCSSPGAEVAPPTPMQVWPAQRRQPGPLVRALVRQAGRPALAVAR